jgi:hypothetical protein
MFNNAKSVAEVVPLAPVLKRDDFRYLVKEFYSEIDQSGLLDMPPTRGTCSSTGPDDLDSDDLVKILTLLSTGLRDIHQQSAQQTMAVSHVLDDMTDAAVKRLNLETVHASLSS